MYLSSWKTRFFYIFLAATAFACASPEPEGCDLVATQVSCDSDAECLCASQSCENGLCVAVLGEAGKPSEGTLRAYDGPTTISAEGFCEQLMALDCQPQITTSTGENSSETGSSVPNSGDPGSESQDSVPPSSVPASMPESNPDEEEQSQPEGESQEEAQPAPVTTTTNSDWKDECEDRYSIDQFAMESAGCTQEYTALRECAMEKLFCPTGMDLDEAMEKAEKKCGEFVTDLSLCLGKSHCDRSGFYCEEPEFSDVCRPRAQSGCIMSEAECEPMEDPDGVRWECTCTQGLNRGLVFNTYDSSCCSNAHFLEETCGYAEYYEEPKPTIESVLGQPCKSDNDCGDAICQVSNFSARPFCTVECDLRNDICHTPGGAGGQGTYYEGFRCFEMPEAFEGRLRTFCAPQCESPLDCEKFDTGFDTCSDPDHQGIPPTGYVAGSYQVCSAPPADPGPPVDPVLCDYKDKVSGPAIIIDVCRSYCSFIETCKLLPDGVSPACCEWGCYLWATPSGMASSDRKADLICFTNAFKGNQENSTVCTAPIDTCGAPPVLEP